MAEAEAWLRARRHTIATHLEEAMSHLSDLIANGKALAAERVALTADRDSERARAEAAQKHAAELQAKLDEDDAAAAAAKEELDVEIAKESGVAGKAREADAQKPAPVITIASSGATVTVVPAGDAIRHEAVDGTVMLVPHDGTTPTATDAQGTPVEPHPAAVAEAREAAAAAGVTAPQAEAEIPTTIG